MWALILLMDPTLIYHLIYPDNEIWSISCLSLGYYAYLRLLIGTIALLVMMILRKRKYSPIILKYGVGMVSVMILCLIGGGVFLTFAKYDLIREMDCQQ